MGIALHLTWPSFDAEFLRTGGHRALGLTLAPSANVWQSNDVYFVVIYYAIPAYYPELELQIVFLSGFNANHLYKAKSRKAWIIHRCLAVSLYLQMCYFREWSLTGQPTNIADDEH